MWSFNSAKFPALILLRKIPEVLAPVLPTNFKDFLPDQPKISAAREKVRLPHQIDLQRPIYFFTTIHDPKWYCKKVRKPVYTYRFCQDIWMIK
jgi:hypothetical protein